MGHGAAAARLQRQSWLGPIQCLDLAFLVDRHDDCVGRWVHIQAHDVFDFGSEGRIVRFFERSDAMRLEAMGLPEALHGAQTDADGFGHHTARPVCCSFWRFATGQRQNFGDRRRGQRSAAGLACLIAQQSVDTFLGKALLPSPYRRSACAAAGCDGDCGQPLGRQKNDGGSLDVFLRPVTILNDGGQTLAIRGENDGVDGLWHTDRITQPNPLVNPLFGSEH